RWAAFEKGGRKLTHQSRLYTAEHIAFTGTGTAYHPETGEVLIYGLADTHKLVNLAQADAYAARAAMKQRQPEFTFNVMDALGEVTAALTKAQCGYLLVLQ